MLKNEQNNRNKLFCTSLCWQIYKAILISQKFTKQVFLFRQKIDYFKLLFHSFELFLPTFFFKSSLDATKLLYIHLGNPRTNLFLALHKSCMIDFVRIYPITKCLINQPNMFPCKTAGYQNKLLGAVMQMDYTSGLDCASTGQKDEKQSNTQIVRLLQDSYGL